MIGDIVSERLILRKVAESDAEEIWEIWSDNEKYMSDPVETVEGVKEICKKHKEETTSFLKAVLLKESNRIIGTCCFGKTNNIKEWGFGYSIRDDEWGKGYATEIVQTIISTGKKFGIESFISEAAIENTGSIRVLEKCGMSRAYKTSFRQPRLNILYESYVYKLNESIK